MFLCCVVLIQLFDIGTSQNTMGDFQYKCPGEYLHEGILMIDPVSELYAINNDLSSKMRTCF